MTLLNESDEEGERELSSLELPRTPSLDLWLCYLRSETDDRETDWLQETLVRNPQCARLVLDLEQFLHSQDEAAAPLAEGEREKAWQEFLRRRGDASPASPAAQESAGGRVVSLAGRRRSFGGWHSLALAALLLISVGGWMLSGLEQKQLAQRLQLAEQPRINVPIVDLYTSLERSRGADEPVSELRVAPEAQGMTLLLYVDEEQPDGSSGYHLRIENAGEKVLWEGDGLEMRESSGALSVALPAGFLAPGSYRLTLSASADAERPIASYRLEVHDSGPARSSAP